MRKGFAPYKNAVMDTLTKMGTFQDTFKEGCRNDDVFNWTLCMMASIDEPDSEKCFEAIALKWKDFYDNRLDSIQKKDIDDWERDVEDVFAYCCYNYINESSTTLSCLWIDSVEYDNPFLKD